MISELKNLLQKQKLPGASAHDKMTPYRSSHLIYNRIPENAKHSAVIILLGKKSDDWEIILIKRQNYKGVHGGQISFPGGKIDAGETAEKAVLREAFEEIGIKETCIHILGRLSQIYIPPSNHLVFPVVGEIIQQPHFTPNEREVEKILSVPLSVFNNNNVSQQRIETNSGFVLNAPCYKYENEIIWGATAAMISEFVEVVENIDF